MTYTNPSGGAATAPCGFWLPQNSDSLHQIFLFLWKSNDDVIACCVRRIFSPLTAPTFSLEIETDQYRRRRLRFTAADPMTTLSAGFILTERQQQSASSSITSTHQQEQHVGQLTVQTADRWRGSKVTPLWGLFNRAEETASGKSAEANLGSGSTLCPRWPTSYWRLFVTNI